MIGRTISHYKILSKLGEGGMGVVYRAEDTRLGRAVAIKLLPLHLGGDEDARKRFVQEAKTASALDHVNICTIHDIDETKDGRLFMVMALCEGRTVKEHLADGPLALARAVDYDAAIEMLDRLEELSTERFVGSFHKALIHLGLKADDRMFECLEKAFDEKDSWLAMLNTLPIWDGLRPDPRFIALMRKVGLQR